MAFAKSCGASTSENAESDLGTDALDGLQRSKPTALEFALKSEQPDCVFAHVRIDSQRDLIAGLQVAQRSCRRLHLVADAMNVDDEKAIADGVDLSAQLADHVLATFGVSAASRLRLAR